MDRREYVCNQMYKQHDLLRKGSWTDADKLEYMELNIAPYSRYWRMGMKKALKHAIRLLREEEVKADRKTEPQKNCEECKHYLFTDIDGYYCEHETYGQPCHYEPKDEPQTDEEQFCREHKCTFYRPQEGGCTKNSGNCPFEDEPQTDCAWK